MSTILVSTRQLVGLLTDLILTSGTDPDVPTTRGVLLHTDDGEYLPDLPGADPDQESLFGPSGAQLLVGTSTDSYAAGQAHVPATFSIPSGWLAPVFVELQDAQSVAREFKTKISILGREITHYTELSVQGGTMTVRENPAQVPGGLRMAFQVTDGSLFPKVHERMQPDPTVQETGRDGEVVPPSYGTGFYGAYVEVFAKVAKRRQMPIALYRHHQNAPVVVEIGASYRAAVKPYTLDEEHGQQLAPTVRVFEIPQRTRAEVSE